MQYTTNLTLKLPECSDETLVIDELMKTGKYWMWLFRQ